MCIICILPLIHMYLSTWILQIRQDVNCWIQWWEYRCCLHCNINIPIRTVLNLCQ